MLGTRERRSDLKTWVKRCGTEGPLTVSRDDFVSLV